MRTAIGLDIGGTRLSAALVAEDGRVLALRRESTPAGGEAALQALLEMARDLIDADTRRGEAPASPMILEVDESAEAGASARRETEGSAMAEAGASARRAGRPVGLGLGFGGPVDFAAQTIVRSHHVAGWTPGLKLAERFAETLGLPAVVDNDANCGGLAEALYGAGRGHGSVLYVNIGTGIGGAIIRDGQIHHGAHSTAGEIGHCVVLPDGPPCTCGKRGCLEQLSSGSALARAGRAAGMGDVTGREVGERAQAGDPTAQAVLQQAAAWLGLALGNAANLLDPDLIVIGGGVADLGDVFLAPARASFAATAMPAAQTTPLVRAALGYDAGVIGAAALILAR